MATKKVRRKSKSKYNRSYYLKNKPKMLAANKQWQKDHPVACQGYKIKYLKPWASLFKTRTFVSLDAMNGFERDIIGSSPSPLETLLVKERALALC